MSWALGYDGRHCRDIGYGVPAYCDHPGCMAEIDRGLAYVCGSDPYGGECGCGLYFCENHLDAEEIEGRWIQLCQNCRNETGRCFSLTPDHPDWIKHKLSDQTWQEWRDENPDEVRKIRMELEGITRRA